MADSEVLEKTNYSILMNYIFDTYIRIQKKYRKLVFTDVKKFNKT